MTQTVQKPVQLFLVFKCQIILIKDPSKSGWDVFGQIMVDILVLKRDQLFVRKLMQALFDYRSEPVFQFRLVHNTHFQANAKGLAQILELVS